MNSSILYLLAGFLIPLIPAYILYKTLPAQTSVSGPFKGLTINLSGAFAGYFLLVLIAFAFTLKNIDDSTAKQLENIIAENANLKKQNSDLKVLYENWTIKGQIAAGLPEKTKLFIDAKNTHISSTGDFSSSLYLKKDENDEIIPTALCFFNTEDGYKVINLNQKTSKDFLLFGITISKEKHLILIDKPIKLRKAILFRDGKP